MAVTYYLRTTNSDLTGGADWNKLLSKTAEGSQTAISASIAGKVTETQYAFSAAGDPGSAAWTTGTWTIYCDVSTAISGTLELTIQRVNSSGAVQETKTSDGGDQNLTGSPGVFTFTFTSLSWSSGNTGDRIRISFIAYNSSHTADTIAIDAGVVTPAGTYTTAPFPTFQTYDRTVADGTELSDAASIEAVFLATAADGSEHADTPSISGVLNATAADGIEISDAVSVERVKYLTAADGIECSDSLGSTATFADTVADGLTASDSSQALVNGITGDRRFFTGWELGDLKDAYASDGTVSVQSSVARTGTYALRANPTTTGYGYAGLGPYSAQWGLLSNSFSLATAYLRVYFRYATKPASGSEEILVVRAASAYKLAIRIDSNGKLSAWDQTGTAQMGDTGTTTLLADTWYRLEVKCGQESGEGNDDGQYALLVDGVVELIGSGNVGTTTTATIRLGKVTNRNGQSVDFYYDDIAIDGTDFPGPGSCAYMLPNGDGDYSTYWTASAGNRYDCIDDNDGDTSYIYESTTTRRYSATIESAASAGVAGTIYAVKATYIARQTGTGGDTKGFLRSSDTDSSLFPSSAMLLATDYHVAGAVFNLNPADSATWELADLDDIEVGIYHNSGNECRCTFMAFELDYNPPPAGEYPLTAAEEIELSDTSASIGIFQGADNDGVTLSDAAAAALVIHATAADGTSLSDSVSAEKVFVLSMPDGIELSDAAGAEAVFGATIADGVELSDGASTLAVFGAAVTDGIELSDGVSALGSFQDTISDGAELSDGVSTELAGIERTCVDGAELSDSASIQLIATPTVADGITCADTTGVEAVLYDTAADGVEFGETVSVTIPASDFTVVDGVELSDTPAGTGIFGVTVADGAEAADAPSATIETARTVADGIEAGDSASTTIGTGVFPLSCADGTSHGDAAGTRAIFDAVAADGIEISDGASGEVIFLVAATDGGVFADTAGYVLSIDTSSADGIALSDASGTIVVVAVGECSITFSVARPATTLTATRPGVTFTAT